MLFFKLNCSKVFLGYYSRIIILGQIMRIVLSVIQQPDITSVFFITKNNINRPLAPFSFSGRGLYAKPLEFRNNANTLLPCIRKNENPVVRGCFSFLTVFSIKPCR